MNSQPHASRSGPWRKMLTSKDANFVGYTYKNSDVFKGMMNSPIAELKKKPQPKRPSIVSLFDNTNTGAVSNSEESGGTHMDVSTGQTLHPHYVNPKVADNMF